MEPRGPFSPRLKQLQVANEKEALDALVLLGVARVAEEIRKPTVRRRLQEFQSRVLGEFEPSWDPSGDVENLDTTTLVEFATTLYGPQFIQDLSPDPKDRARRIREFFQGYFGGDQCAGALRDRPFVPGSTPCWICGFTIPGREPGGFRYECEHVLPIAQAVFFSDLYRGTKTPAGVKPEILQLEYDHSHRVCNQVKNNVHFYNSVGADIRTRRWEVDQTRIRGFLIRLFDNSGFYAPGEGNRVQAEIVKSGKSRDVWIAERTQVIAKRCQDILDKTAMRPDCSPALFILSSLAACTARASEARPPRPPSSPSPPITPRRLFASPEPESEEPSAKRRRMGSGRKTQRHRRRKNRKTRRHLPS